MASTTASEATQPPAVQRLCVPSTTVQRRWSPQYVRPTVPARRVQRHASELSGTDTRHWLIPTSRRARSGDNESDTDSSTDNGSYTALDLQPPRRYRRRPPPLLRLSQRREADDDDTDSVVCELLGSSSLSLSLQGCICQIFTGGVRVSTGD